MTTKTKQLRAIVSPPNGKKSFSLISDEKLISLYAAMLKCRALEQRVQNFVAREKFQGGHYSAIGQEAAIVGVAIDLLPGDIIGPSPLGPVANFVKGAPLSELLRQFNAEANKPCPARDPGHGSLIATGIAMANKTHGNNGIAVAFCSGPMTHSLFEALHFAGIHKLPILFVSWSDARAGHRAPKTENLCVPTIAVDGKDVVAVYRVACEAIAHARKGNGPTLIESTICKLHRHSSIAAGKNLNPAKEKGATVSDPILNMDEYLAGKGLFRKAMKTEIVTAFSIDLDAAINAARKASSKAKNLGAER